MAAKRTVAADKWRSRAIGAVKYRLNAEGIGVEDIDDDMAGDEKEGSGRRRLGRGSALFRLS